MQTEQLPVGVKFVAAEDGIEEYRLENGMKVLLVENRVAPVVTVMVVYRVGSRNEAVGYTGATHLLEHMMFKGTPTFNKGHNTQIAATLQRIGASFNATTWYDRTNYFETVPSDQMELAIKLEADRMRNSYIADEDRQSEMTVVRNELERGQNEPSEVLDEAVYAAAFREHPYHHPTIGWRADVEGVPTARLKEFYDTFYHPNNATAILVGDFERGRALGLITKHFGAYTASTTPIPEVYTEEPEQQGERRLVIRRAGELAIVQVAFHTPGVLGQTGVLSNEELARRAANPPEENDIYPLVVLSAALSNGVTSRLYQALVETQLAVYAVTNADQHRDPGLFNVISMVNPEVEPKRVEETILAELAKVSEEGLTEQEIEKAKQQIIAQEAYSRDGTFNIALLMSEAEAVADWRFYKDYARSIERVTGEDVRRVARLYFTEDNRTVGYFIPKSTGKEDDDGGGGSDGSGSNGQPAGLKRESPRGLQFYREPGANDAGESGAAATSGASSSQPGGAGLRSGISARISRRELQTGARLLMLENHATPTISLRGSLRGGSYFEPLEKPGLARITAEMLERGTLRRTKLEIASQLEAVGAQLDFSADPFSVNIAARMLSKDLKAVLSTIAESLREPSFPEDELEKLKQQAIAGIQEQQASTGFRAYEKFSSLIYTPGNPFYLHPGERLVESINSITVEDVRGFHKERYGGRSLILSLVGDIETSEVERQFEELFADFAGPEKIDIEVSDPEPQSESRREIVLLKDKASVDILLGTAAPLRRLSEDFYAALLANKALGESTLSSRLGLEVRDREGLTYGINSRFRAPSLAAGPWYIGVSVNPNNVERAISSALKVMRDYVEHGIDAEELMNEKASATGAFKVGLATNGGLAQALWSSEFYSLGPDYIDRFPQIIASVTIEEVNRAIRKYFRPDHLTIVIAGDYQQAAQSTIPTA
ncbi:MAG TPA: pitrilysin family protein [Pyrinomonadaceae bacterium]|nr:pitrilysin family protein [Pyrinomonadaceae bacterium]